MTFDYTGFSVLHGEDDPIDAEIMKRVLNDIKYNGDYINLTLGHEIVAWTGNIKNSVPDLILLDIGIPGLNGKEILTALRADERMLSVPIVMMSGSSSLRDYRECIRLGANGYIKKTPDRKMFTTVCQNFIQGWAQLTHQEFF